MLKFKTTTYALGGFEFKVHSPVHSFSKTTLKFGGRGNLFGVKCLIILYINSSIKIVNKLAIHTIDTLGIATDEPEH